MYPSIESILSLASDSAHDLELCGQLAWGNAEGQIRILTSALDPAIDLTLKDHVTYQLFEIYFSNEETKQRLATLREMFA